MADEICVIFSESKEYIFSMIREFKISDDNVFANEFVFDKKDNIIGFDERNIFSRDGGKVKQIKKMNLEGTVWAVGEIY